MDDFFTKKTCDRCGKLLTSRTMSKFNMDCLCLDCSEAEKQLPKYKEAVEAELKAIQEGDLNFPGIGFPKTKGGEQ